MEYYLGTHMPMSLGRLRTHPGFIALSAERGVAAPQSGSPLAYVAMCHYALTAAKTSSRRSCTHAAALQAAPTTRRLLPLFNSVPSRSQNRMSRTFD